MKTEQLLQRYNKPVPRYTSYPTVPQWDTQQDAGAWKKLVQQAAQELDPAAGISVYVHLPYCEALCTYCGCNKKITRNHKVESPYLQSIAREWAQYAVLFGRKPLLKTLHFGGGTPTFFRPEHLAQLTHSILNLVEVHPEADFGFEGHPNHTSAAHLQVLHELGFRRVSYGVQDLDPEVQRLINRVQPFEKVAEVTQLSRELGYTSVNFDLIYGLPLQTADKLRHTILQSLSLRPDRVAFYGYAHVPWKSKAQRLYDESHLPTAAERIQLYLLGRQLFLDAGYVDVGMDHFALPSDPLAQAAAAGQLHRNFMGYTEHNSPILIGLGVSAISDIGTAYAQNSKELLSWQRAADQFEFALDKGYVLSRDDWQRKQIILDLSCKGEVHLPACWSFTAAEASALAQLEADGILVRDGFHLRILPAGKLFTRNVCAVFDAYLDTQAGDGRRFSQAV
jgi:oxygen-independent coproporphyrinogen-3 oxidase